MFIHANRLGIVIKARHSREGGNPAKNKACEADAAKVLTHFRGDFLINWIPAFTRKGYTVVVRNLCFNNTRSAGMTV
jgi:hypothetical protein